MALATATIFKDFFIFANESNTAVMFKMNSPLSISVKNDNFASQVQILDNENITDLFNYKYITFDGYSVFDITDCIKNGKYTTIFVQYLSNIKFDTLDDTFRVDGVSVSDLRLLGLDFSELIKIIGNGANQVEKSVLDSSSLQQPEIIYALKVRLSEIPKNFMTVLDPLNNGFRAINQAEKDETSRSFTRIVNQSHKSYIYETPTKATTACNFDNAVSCFLIIPTRGNFTLSLTSEIARNYTYDMAKFLSTLTALISDLVLTIEITLMNKDTLLIQTKNTTTDKNLSGMPIAQTSIVMPLALFDSIRFCVRFIDSSSGSKMDSCPLFFCFSGSPIDPPWKPTYTNNGGIVENLNYIKVDLQTYEIPSPSIFLSIQILGNLVDISKCYNSLLFIKRKQGKLRVYTNYGQNIYQDITTSWEYVKTAYSNYEAYAKSNIEMGQIQERNTLSQLQKQQRNTQTVDSAFDWFGAVANTTTSALSGDIGGAVMSMVNGISNLAQGEIKHNMQAQNQKANLTLKQAQERERLTSTIIPGSEQRGEISPINFLESSENTEGGAHYQFITNYVHINDRYLAMLEKYIFDNTVMTKFITRTIEKPKWQTLHNFFQAKIINRSGINTKKGFIIFCEVE